MYCRTVAKGFEAWQRLVPPNQWQWSRRVTYLFIYFDLSQLLFNTVLRYVVILLYNTMSLHDYTVNGSKINNWEELLIDQPMEKFIESDFNVRLLLPCSLACSACYHLNWSTYSTSLYWYYSLVVADIIIIDYFYPTVPELFSVTLSLLVRWYLLTLVSFV